MASSVDTRPTEDRDLDQTDKDSGPSPGIFRLISWNIDGLDERDGKARTTAVCDTLRRLAPDVVFLQEVVPQTQVILEARLSSKYRLIPGGRAGYYVCTLVKKSSDGRVTSTDVMPFPNTQMMRSLLKVKASYSGIYLSLMNAHLESTGQAVKERINQLQQSFGEVQLEDRDRVVIFGGDTNLRDKEVSSIGGVPEGVMDLWELCGGDPKTKFTWDTSVNNNLDFDPGRYKPKLRFDRLYLRAAAGHSSNLSIRSFSLIGKDRLPSCDRYPSDHWGIVCDFDVLPAEIC